MFLFLFLLSDPELADQLCELWRGGVEGLPLPEPAGGGQPDCHPSQCQLLQGPGAAGAADALSPHLSTLQE